MNPRPCPYCGYQIPMVTIHGEKLAPSRYARRKTCGKRACLMERKALIKQIGGEIIPRQCECGADIPMVTTTGQPLPKSKYALKEYCRPCSLKKGAERRKKKISPRKCQGICGEYFHIRPDEKRFNFNKRMACDNPDCIEEVKSKAQVRAKLKTARWYRVKPDIVEQFYLRGAA